MQAWLVVCRRSFFGEQSTSNRYAAYRTAYNSHPIQGRQNSLLLAGFVRGQPRLQGFARLVKGPYKGPYKTRRNLCRFPCQPRDATHVRPLHLLSPLLHLDAPVGLPSHRESIRNCSTSGVLLPQDSPPEPVLQGKNIAQLYRESPRDGLRHGKSDGGPKSWHWQSKMQRIL